MQKKSILAILSLFFILIGCNLEDEDERSVIEGYSLGTLPTDESKLTIFVEDSFVGNTIEKLYSVDMEIHMNITDYSVEAYNVTLEHNTKIIIEDTGQQLTINSLFDEEISNHDILALQLLIWSDIIPVTVNVKEDFTKQVSTDRPGYITHSRELLPVYTAKEIKIPPLSKEHFSLHFIDKLNDYHVVIVYSDDVIPEKEIWGMYEDYWDDIGEVSNMTYNTHLSLLEQDFLDIYNLPLDSNTDYPYFFLLDHEGILLETTDWDEVISIVEVNQD
ncbi:MULTISPECIES: hypothetical protein [Bacillaceae]|uniref:Uncharacterized protein n=1 Tax=Evansella alkalicola TaxID=745819 RepID=A0ABS6JPG6_9BACI|nr:MULTISPECIES: hypothetical protein [Bacillaceae]MBU9719986.1 hypothetical protein [Bacillus alkalicola]